MKDPKNMSVEELIELADKIKKSMTKKFLEDAAKIRKARAKSHPARQSQ